MDQNQQDMIRANRTIVDIVARHQGMKLTDCELNILAGCLQVIATCGSGRSTSLFREPLLAGIELAFGEEFAASFGTIVHRVVSACADILADSSLKVTTEPHGLVDDEEWDQVGHRLGALDD